MKQFLRNNARFIGFILVLWIGIQVWQTRHVPAGPLSVQALATPLAVINEGALQPEAQSLQDAIGVLREAQPGRPIAVHVWAEWCTICKLEEGNISALVDDSPVITIAMQSGSPERVLQTMQDRGLRWTTLIDPQGQLAQALGASSVPLFLVVDNNGQVRTPTIGYTSLWGMRLRLLWARIIA